MPHLPPSDNDLTRRAFLQRAALATAAACLPGACGRPGARGKERRDMPNLLFVFPDQFRRQALGCLRQDPVLTPNLDRLAGESLVLTQAVSNCPICSPFRASLLTGKHPFGHGVVTNCNSGAPGMELRAQETCLSDVLYAAGYDCGYIGKWHLEAPHEPYVEPPRMGDGDCVWDEYTPPGPRRHGFDFWHSYGCCDQHLHPHYWEGDAPRDRPARVDAWSPLHEAETAVDFLRRQAPARGGAGRPFALFVSMNPPHTPFEQVPPEYVARYGDATPGELLKRPNVDLRRDDEPTRRAARAVKNYFAAVAGVDEQVGRIVAALDGLGMRDDTIVVFTSDHGEMMGSHGLMHKGVAYEESLGVPFILRWPGRVPARRDDLLLGSPDLMPTLLGLLGLAGRMPAGVEGRDLSPSLRGEPQSRPDAALFYRIQRAAPAAGSRGLRTMRHTYVLDMPADAAKPPTVQLFDNRDDPFQLRNVAHDQPALARELHGRMVAELAALHDPFRPPAGFDPGGG